MLPSKFRIIWPNSFREDFQKSTNQKQQLPVAAIFVNGSDLPQMHPTKFWFIWQSSCSLMNRDEIRTLYRGPPIDASYQVSVHLAKREEKNLKNHPIRNKSRLWWPCLLTDWDEMRNLYRGPSIYASYQVSVHLAEEFQRHISVIQFRYTCMYRDNCI